MSQNRRLMLKKKIILARTKGCCRIDHFEMTEEDGEWWWIKLKKKKMEGSGTRIDITAFLRFPILLTIKPTTKIDSVRRIWIQGSKLGRRQNKRHP